MNLGQDVFYWSQPDPEGPVIANPAKYLGPGIEDAGKHTLIVFFTPLGGIGVPRLEATLVTSSPVAGDCAETLLEA